MQQIPIFKRYQKLPIAVKIILPSLLIFFGASTAAMYGFFTNYIELDYAQNTEKFTQLVANNFQKSEKVLEVKALLLTETPEVIVATAQKSQIKLLQTVLPLQSSQELDLIYIVDSDGQVLFNSRQGAIANSLLRDERIKIAAKSGLQMFDIIAGEGDTPPVAMITIPLKSREKVIGSLVAGYAITNKVLEANRSSKEHHLVVLYNQKVVATTLPAAKRSNWQPPPVEQPATEVSIGAVNYFAKTMQLSQNSGQDVQIVLLNSVERLQEMTRGLALILASFAAFGGIGAIVIGFWTTRWLTRRLNRLTDAVQNFAQGEFHTRIPIDSNDEISRLADTFNTMANQLTERDGQIQAQMLELETTLSQLKQAQTQLVQSEKMSSLGLMVAGVAHEINNPVSFIHGNTEYIKQYTESILELIDTYQSVYSPPHPDITQKIADIELEYLQEDLPKIIKSIQIGSDRIANIVLSLRNFSRLDEAEFKEADIHEGIDSTLMILVSRLKPRPQRPEIIIQKNYANLPMVECYPGQLNQVFMNILSNGIDALEEKIQADPNFDEPIIKIKTEIWQNQQVIITITDNGVGMKEETITKLFDPFFTTKAVGKGTGLGLSISYQIITEKHQGQITCNSTPGEGSEFVISIPIRRQHQN